MKRRPMPTPGRDPLLDAVDRASAWFDRTLPHHRRPRVLLGVAGIVLSLVCLAPILVMALGSLKVTGTLFVPVYSLSVFTPPLSQRPIPGTSDLPATLQLHRRLDYTARWDDVEAAPVVLTHLEIDDQPFSADITGVWAIPGVFELPVVESIRLYARWGDMNGDGAGSEDSPFSLGFRDATGREAWPATSMRRLSSQTPGWQWLEFDLEAHQYPEGFDPRNIRRLLIRPHVAAIEFGPIRFHLHQLGLSNYIDILSGGKFYRYTLNSILVAVAVTLGNVVFSLMVGYAFARCSFRGKSLLWFTVLSALIVPVQTLLVPLFILMQHVPFAGGNDFLGRGGSGWLDTYYVLIVPFLVGPFGVFVMRQYISGMPIDLEESAEIDGANTRQLLTSIIAPLARPAVAVVGITTFMANWNNFLFPYLLTRSDDMRTLPVGLTLYAGQNSTDWGQIMAGATIAALPVIVVFLVFQRFIISGLTSGALKE